MDQRAMKALKTIALVMSISLMGGVGGTQTKGSIPLGQVPSTQNPLAPLGPELSPAQEEKQSRLRNDDRQKRLEADTQKLLELATQLHDDVGKTNKDILSIDVIRRADEIERLAHSVKERMRG